MPDPWYCIKKPFFLDPKSGEVFERMFDSYTDAEFWVTKTLRQGASKK